MMNLLKQTVLIGLVAVGAVGCSNQVAQLPSASPDTEYIDEEISVAPDTGITADDILNNPELYQGTTVNLRAEVEEWLNSRAIVLDAPGVINDNLLVITEDPTYAFEDPEIFGDSIWEVTGTVERFEIITATDTLDFDLAPDLFTIYEGAPYVRASSVELFED